MGGLQPSEAFAGIFEAIRSSIEAGRYHGAGVHAADFITLAYRLQSKTDLFVGEVLEAAYIQIHHATRAHAVPDKDKTILNELMLRELDTLIRAYNDGDGLYEALAEIRYDATAFQHSVIDMYDRVEPSRGD